MNGFRKLMKKLLVSCKLKVTLIYLFKPKQIFSNLSTYIELTVVIMTLTFAKLVDCLFASMNI